MANLFIKHLLLGSAMCAGSALLLTSCIDDSYDVNKIDLTMKLGSEGLSAPLGNTEKIYLDDFDTMRERFRFREKLNVKW